MASRTHSCLHALADYRQIMVQRLLSRHFQFIKNMIIRAAHKNSRLFKPDILYKLKILFARADPAGHLRELIAFLQAFVHSIPVLFAVKEELALTDLPIRSSQSVQIIVDRHDLLRCIRCPGLLAVPECCVCDPDLIRHVVRHDPVIKRDLRYLIIMKQIAEHIRRIHINQREHMLLQLQKICMCVQKNFSVLHLSSSFTLNAISRSYISPVISLDAQFCIIVYNYTKFVNPKSKSRISLAHPSLEIQLFNSFYYLFSSQTAYRTGSFMQSAALFRAP